MDHCTSGEKKRDKLFNSLLIIGCIFYFGHLVNTQTSFLEGQIAHLFHSFFELINTMWWGIALGAIFVGILGQVPREYVVSVLGKPGTTRGIFRAVGAGLLLDLCSHGILMVGMKLYERGASAGQLMAFLIASPWNSFSLTLILIALVGLKWTLIFILASAIVAVVSGLVFNQFEKMGIIPTNPNQAAIPDDFHFFKNISRDLKSYRPTLKSIGNMFLDGLNESKMILKWILLGAVLSSLVKVFVDTEVLQTYFGPTLLGLGATLVATTIMEICSEGSTPIAADLLQRADAPGNAFTFLMAGVATDYTEILSIKSTTRSLKIALLLPAITVPQVLVLGYILNNV